ncbi:hypothetical protein VJ918_02105 [Adlercreutzia sp. R21]|uniref:hypothetical protein n=1 Tax=Adlercreutzia wanghongyangiae TaxID=3111451 RepID=UPI002DBC1035|nr:hypothetical protein [Adlercreutzia sp. R21]MEC4183593.1 hypothetical protein [Adlercreutzia sp. R21]
MFEFLSSPFGLVAVGLGVLAVAVLALCLWITTLDRRMRGMADGLEAERRKVAEMQMVIGRRNNAARSYGNRAARAPQAAPGAAAGVPMGAAAPMPRQAPPAAGRPMPPMGAPGAASAPRPAPASAGAGAAARAAAPTAGRAPQGVSRRRGGGWAPDEPMVASEQLAEAWVQSGGFGQQPIVVPDKKMSRKARREAERAFAARAAAELEARQARRAAESGIAPNRPAPQQGIRPYGGPAAPSRGTHAPAPVPGARPVPRGGSGFPDQYGASAPGAAPAGRGRHAR